MRAIKRNSDLTTHSFAHESTQPPREDHSGLAERTKHSRKPSTGILRNEEPRRCLRLAAAGSTASSAKTCNDSDGNVNLDVMKFIVKQNESKVNYVNGDHRFRRAR